MITTKNFNSIKIAIVHDVLIEHGGAENVLLKFLEMFPKADLYTSLVDTKNNIYKEVKGRIKKSLVLPNFFLKHANLLKPLVYLYWDNLDFSNYDLVISSSGSFSSKSVITKSETLHICYCHTPPRFLYCEYSELQIMSGFLRSLKNVLYSLLRDFDYIGSTRPDLYIANSAEVKKRINKYYRRDALVVYPPVYVPKQILKKNGKGEYYLYVGRLYKQKGVEFLINTFNKNGKELMIIGEGPLRQFVQKKSGANIKYLGYVSNSLKIDYMRNAKALVFPSVDEDFGIVPVEAMSVGTPVLAIRKGGVLESVIEGKTGFFFDDYTYKSFESVIKKFEASKLLAKECHERSVMFSEDLFEKSIVKVINQNLKI